MKTETNPIAAVEAQIVATEQTIQAAKLASEQAEARRGPLLLANERKALDRLDRELEELKRSEALGAERIAALKGEIERLQKLESDADNQRLRVEAEAVAQRMRVRMKKFESLVAELVPLLELHSVDSEALSSFNTQLHKLGLPFVADPEYDRRQPVTVVPEQVIESMCEYGVFSPDGKPWNPENDGYLKMTRTVVPESRTGGLQPAPFHRTVVLPAVFWGGPGWLGGDPLGYYSPPSTPATALKAAREKSA